MSMEQTNRNKYGFSSRMGPKLREFVENQLINDLMYYKIESEDFIFDWSESCIEGHGMDYLDGEFENFSGIEVFNKDKELLADGWMEFIRIENEVIIYWEFVTTWKKGKKLKEKREVGIPKHVWNKIPDSLKPKFKHLKMKK